MRSLGRLYCTTSSLSSRINSSRRRYAFPRSLISFPFSLFSQYGGGGYAGSKHLCTQVGNHINSFKEVEKQSITKGDIIRLNELLFTGNRDYLVRNNNQHVKAEQLKDKVIGIYFLPLCQHPLNSKWCTSVLEEVYNDLKSVNNFEVVLVPIHDDGTNIRGAPPLTIDPQKHFEDLFSFMPWTAIPFSDAVSSEQIERHLLGHQKNIVNTLFVVDPTGMILQGYDPWNILFDFGALGYPFSDERIDFLRAEDDAAAKQPSLKTLLASPQRNYVISSNGDEVPLHTFEDKVVALYFYHVNDVNEADEDLKRALKSAYEELAKTNNKFEVVLVYFHDYEDGWRSDWEKSFWKEFKTMPWLALPFRDESCKKLMRIFEESNYWAHDKLVILGPHAEFIETSGASILFQYNISAYPFTRKKLVELEIEKIKELKLEMLWDPNTFLRRNNGSWVPISALSGKRVMLILERFDVESDFYESSPHTKFSLMLKGRYLQMEGTDDEFEVIRILIDNTGYYFTRYGVVDLNRKGVVDLNSMEELVELQRDLGHGNWMVSLASKLRYDLGSSDVWYGKCVYDESYLPVFAFDRDGRLVRKTIYPSFENMEFPFYSGSLEDEMLSQLARVITDSTS